jgi:hypothetical protein
MGIMQFQSFANPRDNIGSEQLGLTRMNRLQVLTDTLCFADNEHGSWPPIITALGALGSIELHVVWNPAHLPYAAGGATLNPDRRVARSRHGLGSKPHVPRRPRHLKKANRIVVDDRREQF